MIKQPLPEESLHAVIDQLPIDGQTAATAKVLYTEGIVRNGRLSRGLLSKAAEPQLDEGKLQLIRAAFERCTDGTRGRLANVLAMFGGENEAGMLYEALKRELMVEATEDDTERVTWLIAALEKVGGRQAATGITAGLLHRNQHISRKGENALYNLYTGGSLDETGITEREFIPEEFMVAMETLVDWPEVEEIVSQHSPDKEAECVQRYVDFLEKRINGMFLSQRLLLSVPRTIEGIHQLHTRFQERLEQYADAIHIYEELRAKSSEIETQLGISSRFTVDIAGEFETGFSVQINSIPEDNISLPATVTVTLQSGESMELPVITRS